MGIVVGSLEESAPRPFPTTETLDFQGVIESRPIIVGDDRPITVWVQHLAPGACISWARSATGQGVYLWRGAMTAAGRELAAGAAVVIEQQGSVDICATGDGATLVHFLGAGRPEGQSSEKPGGHAHVLSGGGIFQSTGPANTRYTLFADCACPSCDLWMHRARYTTPRAQGSGGVHLHTTDEITFIIEGGLQTGGRILKPGAALAVDANTIYAIGIPDGGMTYVNFRLHDSDAFFTKKRQPVGAPINERDWIRGHGAGLSANR